jgi:hypothetical protein
MTPAERPRSNQGEYLQRDGVLSDADFGALTRELGRAPRGVMAVAYRCDHGLPAVVQTAPVLPDGTPFPTLYYLCCSELNSTVGRMESQGVMARMNEHLQSDADLAQGYRRAHESYLKERNAIADLGIDVSAGGMPDRVKCLHVLVAHALGGGPGINPLGDEAVRLLPDYSRGSCCVPMPQRGPDQQIAREPGSRATEHVAGASRPTR